jgi:hypothetical protein
MSTQSSVQAVGAGGDVDDEFAPGDHGGAGSGQMLTRARQDFHEVDLPSFKDRIYMCPSRELKMCRYNVYGSVFEGARRAM